MAGANASPIPSRNVWFQWILTHWEFRLFQIRLLERCLRVRTLFKPFDSTALCFLFLHFIKAFCYQHHPSLIPTLLFHIYSSSMPWISGLHSDWFPQRHYPYFFPSSSDWHSFWQVTWSWIPTLQSPSDGKQETFPREILSQQWWNKTVTSSPILPELPSFEVKPLLLHFSLSLAWHRQRLARLEELALQINNKLAKVIS